MTGINHESAMRVSDADRNGTLRRLHNAVALGLIDIDAVLRERKHSVQRFLRILLTAGGMGSDAHHRYERFELAARAAGYHLQRHERDFG